MLTIKMCAFDGFALTTKRAVECYSHDEPFTCNEDCAEKLKIKLMEKYKEEISLKGISQTGEVKVMPPVSKNKPDGLIPIKAVTQKGMIIKGFVPQLAELGKIKIGRKGTNTTGTGYRLPEKFDHFEIVTLNKDKDGNFIPDEVMKQFTEPPKELNIMLLYNDETLCFSTRYNAYKGGKCVCAGDGEAAIQRDGTKVECNPDTCPVFNDKKCKLNGILSVILLDAPKIGGVYKFRTTGFNTVRSILSSLMFIKTLTGGVLAMIPLKMTVTPKMVQPKDGDKAHTIYVVNIEYPGTGQQLLEKVLEVSKHQGAMRAEIKKLESQARQLQAAPESEEEIKDIEEEFCYGKL